MAWNTGERTRAYLLTSGSFKPRKNRTFDSAGLMEKRHMSGNEVTIREDERWFRDGVDIDAVDISDVHG